MENERRRRTGCAATGGGMEATGGTGGHGRRGWAATGGAGGHGRRGWAVGRPRAATGGAGGHGRRGWAIGRRRAATAGDGRHGRRRRPRLPDGWEATGDHGRLMLAASLGRALPRSTPHPVVCGQLPSSLALGGALFFGKWWQPLADADKRVKELDDAVEELEGAQDEVASIKARHDAGQLYVIRLLQYFLTTGPVAGLAEKQLKIVRAIQEQGAGVRLDVQALRATVLS